MNGSGRLSDLRVGVDFDNTIVCYDGLFHAMALKQGLIPSDTPVNKTHVRDYLRRVGKEDVWTRMQGEAYGPSIGQATAFEGVLDFFKRAREANVETVIISHKTRHPYAGPAYDLHGAAMGWLEQNGFFHPDVIGLGRQNVYLELTKQEKIQRIGQLGCTHFIDDLPELLAEASFPSGVERILFDPGRQHTATGMTAIDTWGQAWNTVMRGRGGGA